MSKKWFKRAVNKAPPYNLGGWKKNQSNSTRRRNALSSRPKSWSLRRKRRSTGQALISLSNVTKDKSTKNKARQDAHYFFRMLK